MSERDRLILGMTQVQAALWQEYLVKMRRALVDRFAATGVTDDQADDLIERGLIALGMITTTEGGGWLMVAMTPDVIQRLDEFLETMEPPSTR